MLSRKLGSLSNLQMKAMSCGDPEESSCSSRRSVSTTALAMSAHRCEIAEFDRLVARQQVHAFVIRIAGVALDPAPFDGVALGGDMQALPEVAVLDRIAAG